MTPLTRAALIRSGTVVNAIFPIIFKHPFNPSSKAVIIAPSVGKHKEKRITGSNSKIVVAPGGAHGL